MTRVCAIPVVLAIGLLAGCGSGGKSDAAARTAYINKIDAICARTNSDLKESNTRLDELARSARRVSEFTDDLVDGNQLAHDELADIKAIPVPKGAEDEMKTVIAARAHQLALIDKLTAAARANDATAFRHLTDEVQAAKKTAQGEADKFGFKICGQG